MKRASELIVEFLKDKKSGAMSDEIVKYCFNNNVESKAEDVYKSIHGSLSKMKKAGKVERDADGRYFLSTK